MKPWDARVAAWMVRPLRGTRVHPNHLTTARLAVGLLAAALLAAGGSRAAWGAALFALSCLADHADGELARMSGKTSAFGHAYDYAADALVTTLAFAGLGLGLRGELGPWAPVLGLIAGAAVASMFGLRFVLERRLGKRAAALPSFAGFEVEDVLYLFPLVVWLGGSKALLVASFAGAPLFLLWLALDARQRAAAIAGAERER